ncbi:MAG: anthranilate phosphoribosyltransferase [Patescibacteria group bacterium]
MDTTTILNKLINKKNLTAKETGSFLLEVINGSISNEQAAAIITALRMKGETVEEIYGFIKTLRKNMISINLNDAIDVCGTGGDGSGTFNVSTAVAFVVAGAGIKVAKHGNRAASSSCGSADVLEALGVNINLTPKQAEQVFKKIGMVFLFAPLYHPAMKNVVTIRKELKIRTIFNFLGPFINPSRPARQLIGVPDEKIAEKLTLVSKKLGSKHVVIATSEDGLDEISIGGKTTLFELKNNSLKKYAINPIDFGFKRAFKSEILGGNAKENALIINKIFTGLKDAKRNIVVFNSGVALYIAGAAKNIKEGIKLAEFSIDSGKAKLILENLIKETQKYE